MPLPKSMQSENSPKSSSSDGDLNSFSKTSGLCGYRGHNCRMEQTAFVRKTIPRTKVPEFNDLYPTKKLLKPVCNSISSKNVDASKRLQLQRLIATNIHLYLVQRI